MRVSSQADLLKTGTTTIPEPIERTGPVSGMEYSRSTMPETDKAFSSPRNTNPGYAAGWIYPSVFALLVARLWILPMRDGFWADETGSVWALQGGLRNIIARCSLWPAQSPAYSFVIALLYKIKGPNEILLRLPSLVAMSVAAYMLYRLATRLLGASAAWPSLIVFAGLAPVAFAAGDARPYAIATMGVIGAMLFLVRWLDDAKISSALLSSLFAVLAVYMHFLFITPLLVQLLYAVYRIRTEKRVSVTQLAAVGVTTGILLAPFAYHFLRVMRTAHSHSFAGTPSLTDLAALLVPPVLVAAILGYLFVLRLMHQRFQFALASLDNATLLLLTTWALVPAALLYGASTLTSIKVFLPRYALPSEVALALFAGWVIGAISPVKLRAIAIAIVAVAVLLAAPSRNYAHGGDWRAAVAAVNKTVGNTDTPVLIRSDFPEAEPFDWIDDPVRQSYLFAPLAIYPTAGTVVPLPYRVNAQSDPYLNTVLSHLETRDRFLLINMGDPTYQSYLLGRFAPLGFTRRRIGSFGGSLGVDIFERHSTSSAARPGHD